MDVLCDLYYVAPHVGEVNNFIDMKFCPQNPGPSVPRTWAVPARGHTLRGRSSSPHVLYDIWHRILGTPQGVHQQVFYRRPQLRNMSREREDTGRYTETVTLDDVLGVFETVDGPVVTSGDVAEARDCSRETARRKLRTLEEQGRVASRKTAGRVVWWVVDEHAPARGVDPKDSFWEFEPGASGESDVSENVDKRLYSRESA